MNRRVLIVCYYFPPMGLAGVRRPLALFNKLPDYGYQPDILTVKPVTYFVYEPHLLEGLDNARIHRSGSSDPQRLMWLLGKRTVTPAMAGPARTISSNVFPDSKKGWVRPAVNLGRTLIENYRYDAIISTSPPISAHLIARKLAGEFKLPWLADFRDFWTMDRIEDQYDRPSLIKKGQELLGQITTSASEITGVNEQIVEYLGRGETIRNGFDAERVKLWRTESDHDRFLIGVPANQVGKANLDPLWKLLASLGQADPSVYKRIGLLQVGVMAPDQFTAQARNVSSDLQVECLGYLKGDEYLNQLSRASAIYVGLTDDMADSIVPSRIYELLASGRSLLAYCRPESELARLIEDNRCGLSFTNETIRPAVERLTTLLELHTTNQLSISPLPEFVQEFSTDKMTEKFAKILDRII